ncbi:hypothetical protein IWX90DRAFT_16657 [Phyllosticta citrichinensis]|uniref:Uncharacterized protein n=1 Tax=Phyllosticta citrichinensis TaxID=1130410 RepID=A0ABR1Y630_9PEZI
MPFPCTLVGYWVFQQWTRSLTASTKHRAQRAHALSPWCLPYSGPMSPPPITTHCAFCACLVRDIDLLRGNGESGGHGMEASLSTSVYGGGIGDDRRATSSPSGHQSCNGGFPDSATVELHVEEPTRMLQVAGVLALSPPGELFVGKTRHWTRRRASDARVERRLDESGMDMASWLYGKW